MTTLEIFDLGYRPIPQKKMAFRKREDLPDPNLPPEAEVNRLTKILTLRLTEDEILDAEALAQYYGTTRSQYMQEMLRRIILANMEEIQEYLVAARLSFSERDPNKEYTNPDKHHFVVVADDYVFTLPQYAREHAPLIMKLIEADLKNFKEASKKAQANWSRQILNPKKKL